MLKLKPGIIRQIEAASRREDLYAYLQNAIELEHATIPLYLNAAYSIKAGQNIEAQAIFLTIAREEMLHMTIACNVLNAIGGSPVINQPKFIPLYPGPLPMNVDDGLKVTLQAASRDYIYQVLMALEEPDHPLDIEVDDVAPARPEGNGITVASQLRGQASQRYASIGDFYQAIKRKLRQLPPQAYEANRHQVVNATWFPPSQLFAVSDAASACRALDVIVEQGEGSLSSPLESPSGGAPAHYYRLAEIFYGRRLVVSPDGDDFSYSGAPVPLDPLGLWKLYPSPKAVDYPPGSKARFMADQFNYTYTALLDALHHMVNGHPEVLETAAMGLMFELKLQAAQMVSTPLGDSGYQVAPTFEYRAIAQ